MPSLRASQCAVAGTSCIGPHAPAHDCAALAKRDSWRIEPQTHGRKNEESRYVDA